MSKMREGIALRCIENCEPVSLVQCNEYTAKYGSDSCRYCGADQIIAYLKENNVKQVVDRELPEYHHPNYMLLGDEGRRDWDNKKIGMKAVQEDMLKAGYVAVKELDED